MKELDPSHAEQLADLLFEMGSDQAMKFQYSEAIRWLERAHDVLANQKSEQLSGDAGELQLSIMHGMVKAFMKIGGDSNNRRAWNIVGKLDAMHGDRLVVLLLKLDLYDTDPTSSPHEYCDVLDTIVRSVHLTDSNVKTILHQVHKLRLRNARLAHILLSTLISERLLGSEETAWLEKALITVVWNCTTSTDLPDALELLNIVFDTVAANLSKHISPSATHAAHIVRGLSRTAQHLRYRACILKVQVASVETYRDELQ